MLALTSVHHVYGARVYGTPWRYHVLFLSLPAIAVVLWARSRLRRSPGDTVARVVFVLTTLAVPVLGIGVFEGAYNHLAKVVLYFSGASAALMARLFPPPTYELPNDVFFEGTGIAQALVGASAAVSLLRFVTRHRGERIARTIAPGATLPGRWLTTVTGEGVHVPDAGAIVHLQLRRFAGCPVCNLHLRSFVRRRAELNSAGIREVVVFHSPPTELRAHAEGFPLTLIADPDKKLYTELGVGSSSRAVVDPRAWGAMAYGIFRSALAIARRRELPPALRPHGGRLGLPADFLIATDGRVLAAKYGVHADDQWSVDEVIALARRASG